MKITFVGAGYVGLVSGVMMSGLGHEVTCIDVDEKKIKALKEKILPIFEPGLEEYIEKYAGSRRLNFTHIYDHKLSEAECIFITVGTPSAADGNADLKAVYASIEAICPYISPDCVIAVKSTVPPGTCNDIEKFLRRNNYSNEVVSNPEFLREGSAIIDFTEPDRIVIGASHERAFKVMRDIYRNFIARNIPIVETDLKTSELIKYAANSFLACKIAFINEISDLCEVVGGDISTLSEGIGLDKRIGTSFLNPGPGFGGSCFPKDIRALQRLSKNVNSDFLVLDAVIKSNTERPQKLIQKIMPVLGGFKDKKIGILGLTYKAKTDDIRSSPAIEIINLLREHEADIIAYDPEGMINAPKYFKDLKCARSALEAAEAADAIIVLTEWEEFKYIDFDRLKELMKTPNIFDLRNIFNPREIENKGFHYYSIGRKNSG